MRDAIDHDSLHRQVAYRRLDWTRLPLRDLEDEPLQRILTWSEAQLARHGSCHVPISSRVLKERVRGTTGRKCWRWVVYTWIPGGRRVMRHGEYLRRHVAQCEARLAVARRWADELQRDASTLEPQPTPTVWCSCRGCQERVLIPGLCADCLDAGCDATGESECTCA